MAGSINLFVAQLDKRVNDSFLRKEFEKFGDILCAEVTKDEMGIPMGFGFVHFSSMADGLKAIKKMSGKTLLSRTIHVDIANKQVPPKKNKHHATYTSTVDSLLQDYEASEASRVESDKFQVDEQNMNCSDKLDEYKKEIRSILISYQKGCYLPELTRTYRELIGKRLPSKELGFKTDIDFLYALPDVVKITPSRGDYHLIGIADEKSFHIQKMVCRQKPAKLKPPPPRSSRSYNHFSAPPRFSESISKLYKYLPEDKSSPVTNSASVNLNSTPVHRISKTVPSNSKPVETNSTSPKEEIVSLVKQFKNGIALTNLLCEYKNMYNKSFSLSGYGFASLEECIENVSELDIVNINNESRVIHGSESSRFLENNQIEKGQEETFSTSRSNLQKSINGGMDLLNHVENSDMGFPEISKPKSSYSRNKISVSGSVPDSMMNKLEKVAKKFSEGIWSSSFPSCFEEATNSVFDLHSIGYKSLADFIDDIPEIFFRKFVAGSKSDYFIYPADKINLESNGSVNGLSNFPEVGLAPIDQIIINIRKILEAYSEGIPVKDFLHIYSINCQNSLYVSDFGFGDLLTFLSSIKERVPLKFQNLNGMKSIHLLKLSELEIELPYASPELCKEEAIPFDAEFPEFQFKQLSFPKSFDFTKYFPVFVSSIVNPSHLYIQLQDGQNTNAFGKMADELENFYNGDKSKLYTMKNVHIKPGAVCAALWPTDQHWYRAQILSIHDMQTVRVHYIDYGTRDDIPKSLLRYLKKEYTKLPIQALKCSLAFIKPAKNETQWNQQAKQYLLKMCSDIPVMAKIEEKKENNVYSVILCDTNDDQDVYINDELCKKLLADYVGDGVSSKSISLSPEPSVNVISEPVQSMEYHSLNPLQALQAQYFLQAFAAVAPSFAQNEYYLTLLRQISMHCPNVDPMKPNSNFTLNPFGVPNGNLFPSGGHSLINSNPLARANPNVAAGTSLHFDGFTVPTNCLSPSNDYTISPPIRSPTPTDVCSTSLSTSTTQENQVGDSEIFDDDDADFEKLCQKLSTKCRRFVKRVMLGDGNKIHIILLNSKPYASSGDISRLIWNNKEAHFLLDRLQRKEVDIPPVNISQDGNEELFSQLERLNVKGVQKTTGFKASILLYPLSEVIKILNVFGHPSLSLRRKLQEEIYNFNPSDEIWQEFSTPEILESNENEVGNLKFETDDEKIQKLCLVDLNTLKDSIKCRRLQMMSDLKQSSGSKSVDEISNLEKMQLKVLKRIEEIKKICEMEF